MLCVQCVAVVNDLLEMVQNFIGRRLMSVELGHVEPQNKDVIWGQLSAGCTYKDNTYGDPYEELYNARACVSACPIQAIAHLHYTWYHCLNLWKVMVVVHVSLMGYSTSK